MAGIVSYDMVFGGSLRVGNRNGWRQDYFSVTAAQDLHTLSLGAKSFILCRCYFLTLSLPRCIFALLRKGPIYWVTEPYVHPLHTHPLFVLLLVSWDMRFAQRVSLCSSRFVRYGGIAILIGSAVYNTSHALSPRRRPFLNVAEHTFRPLFVFIFR